jgi:hypothetical protein
MADGPTEPPPACWLRDDPADLELRISRFDSASTVLDADTLKVCYSRPRKLDRPMGRLVPHGVPWRLGANEATVLQTPIPLMIGEAEIPAGSYSLYAIPGPERWELIVNGTTERWGVPLNDQVRSADVDTAIAVVEPASQLMENFTRRFERRSATTVDLVWEWESTLVRVPIRRSDS